MNKTIRGILFDKDGTLLDYQKSWSGVNEEVANFAAAGNLTLKRELLIEGGMNPDTKITQAGSLLAAGNTKEICKQWVKSGSPIPLERLIDEIDRIFLNAAKNSIPVDDLETTISNFHEKNYILGVASSDSEAGVEAFLNTHTLRNKFSFIAGYDSGYGHKPSAGMLLGFCNTMNLLPQEVAVIGDNTHDLEMARAGKAGLSIGVLTGTSNKEDLSSLSDFVLDSISKLRTLTALS